MKHLNLNGITNSQSGFTMVEVLVALVILSVGLLGLAGLQTRGLQGNHSSLLRAQATMLGSDILDRMRANRDNALGGDYDLAMSDASASANGATGLVLTDLTEWLASLSTSLPQGDGSIAVNGQVANITIQWTDSSGNDSVAVVSRL